MMPIRVVLLEPGTEIAERVGNILQGCHDIELAGHYQRVYELTQLCPHRQPDIVLIGGSASDPDPLSVIRSVRVLCPGTRILVSSGVQETADLRVWIANGVSGYIPFDELLDSLPNTLRSVHAGKSVFSLEIMQRLLH